MFKNDEIETKNVCNDDLVKELNLRMTKKGYSSVLTVLAEKTDDLASIGVKKHCKLSENISEKESGGIPLVNTEKKGLRLGLKSAKTAPKLAVNICESSVVCLPDLEIEKFSQGPMARGKSRKSVKELKKEIEMKSMRPLTSYFERKSQILEKNHTGMSNENNEKKSFKQQII